MSAPQGEIPTIWTTGYTDVFNTGTWRAALPVHQWRPSPCHVDCPIDNAIPRWIKGIDENDHQAGWLALVETNPFPAVTGRVCHHPCEGHCNRAVLEAAVGINGLEQFLGDLALEEGWALPGPGEAQGKRVAVVGGGPAGLSCAYHLRRLGYEVSVYEARERLGGLLRYGIPGYRLAEDVVDREIARIVDLGVQVHTGSPLSDPGALERLREEHDAVFIGVGAQRAKRLIYLEESAGAERVLDGLEYLRRCTEGVARDLGERMVVVGGGSAAMDVARTARRLGHTVTVVSLETRAVMPAQPEEVEEALEEGVALFDGAMVVSASPASGGAAAEGEAGGGLTLSCQKVTLDMEAPPGELRPLPIAGSEFGLSADVIVTAIGQDPELGSLSAALAISTGGIIAVDPETLAAEPSEDGSAAGVFAGGDVAGLVRYVSEAIGAGRRAAYGIAAHLGHADVEVPPRYSLEEAVNRKEVNVYYFDFAARNERERAPVADRLAGYSETVQGFASEAAGAEAARCMTCGTCVECDNCFIFCPDMAVARDAEGEARYAVLEQYCKGCGLCVTECPRGAVHLEQVTR